MARKPAEPPDPPTRHAPARASDAPDTLVHRHARTSIPGFLLIASFLPVIIANGVLSWTTVLAFTALALVMAFAAWRLSRAPVRSYAWMVLYSCGSALLLAVLSRLTSSFAVVSALATFITMLLVTYPAFLRRPWVVIATIVAGFVIPISLEVAGALSSTWLVVDGALILRGDAVQVDGGLSVVSIVLATVAAVVMAGLQSVKLARANRDAQHRLVIQAWHLRQLLPAPVVPVGMA